MNLHDFGHVIEICIFLCGKSLLPSIVDIPFKNFKLRVGPLLQSTNGTHLEGH
jgi:hypothetical protein